MVAIIIIAFIILRNYLAKVKINKLLDKQNEEIEGLLLDLLEKELPKECVFHNGEHTVDVYTNSQIIGKEIGLSQEDIATKKAQILARIKTMISI